MSRCLRENGHAPSSLLVLVPALLVRHAPTVSRRNHRRPCPRLIHGLHVRGKEAEARHDCEWHVPAHRWLGSRRGACQRISAPYAGGWREVLSQVLSCGTSGARPAHTASSVNWRSPTRYLADLRWKCFNCPSSMHRVATCKLPTRCLRCKGFRHLAQDYKRRRTITPSSGTSGATEDQP
jgi:hypothetical protein